MSQESCERRMRPCNIVPVQMWGCNGQDPRRWNAVNDTLQTGNHKCLKSRGARLPTELSCRSSRQRQTRAAVGAQRRR